MADSPDYDFQGTLSREVLENYLNRSITMADLSRSPQLGEDLRMLANTGAKFIGRAALLWHPVAGEDADGHFRGAAEMVAAFRERGGDAVFQGAIFECVFESEVTATPVPAWVFEEFGLPVETRNFNYPAMCYDENCARQMDVNWAPHPGNNYLRGRWSTGSKTEGSVPDMSKPETQMWFYYRARRYIDAGLEALHLGQIHMMDHNDLDYAHWWSLLERIRAYGRAKARRGRVMIDAHTHGVALADGRLLFDFHSYPMHIREIPDRPQHGELETGFRHAIYGQSLGGTAPDGWTCAHLPCLVEFDNWGPSGRRDQVGLGPNWVWGYNEIDWFANQPEDYRNAFLRYAWKRVPELDPDCHLQMPGRRALAVDTLGDRRMYYANMQSEMSPTGFNQEETIKAIWAGA